jgi:hypothetical protein
MNKKAEKSKGNPYKILYWMGAGLVLLVLGVVLLIKFAPHQQGAAPDPERTMIWLSDGDSAQVLILEESRSAGKMAVTALNAPADVKAAYGGSHSLTAQQKLAALADRQIHHRVFLPYSVVATLVDAAKGVMVDGRQLSGPEAIAYIKGGGADMPDRAARVMLALARAVSEHGVTMSATDGLRLARQVDTNIDLTDIPDVLARWSQYPNPVLRAADAGGLPKVLMPDQR